MTKKERFHRILGHVNFKYLNNICKNKIVDGMPENLEYINLKCGTCIKNKMNNLPFHDERTQAEEIMQIISSDVNGPHQTIGFDGSKYFVTFIDEYSKCAIVYTIKSKNEVYDCFLEYIIRLKI